MTTPFLDRAIRECAARVEERLANCHFCLGTRDCHKCVKLIRGAVWRTMLTRALEIMHNVCACGQLNDEYVCVPCEVKREWELIAKNGLEGK